MSLAANFLGGAKSRLLPASIPFRFFAAAVAFHVVMWACLLADAGNAVGFRGGLGPTLAALHALTLGVLVMTSIGASVQLLPVATRRPLAAVWPIRLVFWIAAPATAALIGGMYTAQVALLVPAAIAVTAGLLLYCGLLADNLRRARSVPVAAAYGWAALAAFVLVIFLGALLAINNRLGMLAAHDHVALAHLILGGFGFMGLLALGFSHILVPMFALSEAPSANFSFLSLGLAVFAIIVAVLGAIIDSSEALTIATIFGFAAAAIHVRLMLRTLQNGMRKRLGLSFVLIKTGWLALLATPLVGLCAIYGWAGSNGPTLFAVTLFGAWLLTFLLGVLQRILPFLASMHAVRSAGGAAPLLSDLAASRPLQIHALCHAIAICSIAVAIAVDNVWLMRVGCLVGLTGAIAFAFFTGNVIRRIAWTEPALAPARPTV